MRKATIDPEASLKLLRTPFPDHQISQLPKETKAQIDARRADRRLSVRCQVCGQYHHRDSIHLDYVGHAALTDRLLDADLEWNWEPVAFTDDGQPARDKAGGMWIKLTVAGVTRLGYGHADGKSGGDAIKEIIGDALRNAAMRFGAALDLWHKGELHLPDGDGSEDENGASGPSAVLQALISNVPKTSKEHAVAWKDKQKEQIDGLSEHEFEEFRSAWVANLQALSEQKSSKPTETKPSGTKPISSAEQKRQLAEIEKDLIDVHTEAALKMCADGWQAKAEKDGWSRDYKIEAKKRFDRRRREIIEAEASSGQQDVDDYFPGDSHPQSDVRNHPLNAG